MNWVPIRTWVQADLNQVAAKLNARPRKTLDFDTPTARFEAALGCPVEPTLAGQVIQSDFGAVNSARAFPKEAILPFVRRMLVRSSWAVMLAISIIGCRGESTNTGVGTKETDSTIPVVAAEQTGDSQSVASALKGLRANAAEWSEITDANRKGLKAGGIRGTGESAEDAACAGAAKRLSDAFSSGGKPDALDLVTAARCRVRAENREKCAGQADTIPCGKVVVVPSTAEGPNYSQIEIHDVSTPDGLKKTCGSIAGAATYASTGNPLAAMIAAPAGAYSCDSYMRALNRLDPLLIVAPGLIPLEDLSDDVAALARKAKQALLKNPALGAAAAAAAPGVVIGIATYDVVHKTFKGVVKVGRSTTQGAINAAGDVIKRPGDVPGNVGREVQRGARNVCRVVFRHC